MIFIFILIFGVLFLFVNLRQVAPGNKGSILAGALVVLLPVCFICREMFWACVGQAFLSVWLCEALLIYVGWWIFRLCRRIIVRRPMPQRTTVIAARVLLIASFAVTGVMCVAGYFHNADYKLRDATIQLLVESPRSSFADDSAVLADSAQVAGDSFAAVDSAGTPVPDTSVAADSAQVAHDSAAVAFDSAQVLQDSSVTVAPWNFTVLFFSDLHLDPLSRRDKVERMLREADSLKPDLIFFGGDFADEHDSVLTNQGYDTLFAKFAAAARVGAYAVGGNHEAYTERAGSDIAGFLRRSGWVYLDDSTVCTEVACITGRTDLQMAAARGVERMPLSLLDPAKLGPSTSRATPAAKGLPWLLMDHQPRGIEPEYSGRMPDFAFSGHTHAGQFFPGTVIINWVWRLAYGFGTLDSVRWLVSSGVDSWGPPVRVGSDTEMWFLRFEMRLP